MYKSRDAKVKKQKETHSEIERKRRERMKRETEFLANQLLDNTVRKDKLSIYKAGAEQLINYTEKLGKRDFILNDTEYSAIIVNNFSGLSFQIVCSDGEILWCNKSKSILGIDEHAIIGSTLFNICEQSDVMMKVIENNLSTVSLEDIKSQHGATELLSRNFIVKMKVSDKITKTNCVRGNDGKWYRYVELCGDIFLNTDELCVDENGSHIVFKCMGRPLDLASPDAPDGARFSLKINPDNCHIINIFGKLRKLLGYWNNDMVNKNLVDFIIDEEKQYFKNSFNECISTKEPMNLLINFKLPDKSKRPFTVTLNAIYANKRLLFVIGKFVRYIQKFEPPDDVSWIKVEADAKEFNSSNIDANNETEQRVTFGLDEPELNVIAPPSSGDLTQQELSDCEYLPNNDSFRSLLGDCNELFYPEAIQDLVLEDINDIKCDDTL